MEEAALEMKTRGYFLAGGVLASILVNFGFFRGLFEFSTRSDFSSHIFIIPFLSLVLLYRKRDVIFKDASPSVLPGAIVCVVSVALFILRNDMSARMLAIVILWIGMFILVLGTGCFRKAMFPMLFLLMMVPIPPVALNAIIEALQRGSAEFTAVLFKLTGTPYYRDGVTFVLPRLNIEIATQCSSIRSSLVLLITCLLVSHLILRNFWYKAGFVLLAVPMAMVKNAIRIVTLSLLSIHIDPKFLANSDLHREGGILFFITALLLLFPILWFLRRLEHRAG